MLWVLFSFGKGRGEILDVDLTGVTQDATEVLRMPMRDFLAKLAPEIPLVRARRKRSPRRV